MTGRSTAAPLLALIISFAARPVAAQPADPPSEGAAPEAPADPPPDTTAPPDATPAPPADPPPEVEAPAAPEPEPEPEPPSRTAPPPATTPPPRTAPPPATTPPPRTAPPPATAAAPPATTAPAPAPASDASPAPAPPPARESVRESTRRRTEADRKQRFRHGGLIIDAKVGAAGCLRQVCSSSTGHHAAPGLNLGGFFGFNLFGLIELGIEGGWTALKPRGVAGRNALNLYGLDPAVLQDALLADQSLPFPPLPFTQLDVSSATSRAFDIGPSLRIHLLRKGRGLLFVGAGVHYQLWRNRYATSSGDLTVALHGASIPLRVGAGVFITRNIGLLFEVAYAPAFFGGMTFRLGDQQGLAPFKVIEDVTGRSVTGGMPHFWSGNLTLRFRLGR